MAGARRDCAFSVAAVTKAGHLGLVWCILVSDVEPGTLVLECMALVRGRRLSDMIACDLRFRDYVDRFGRGLHDDVELARRHLLRQVLVQLRVLVAGVQSPQTVLLLASVQVRCFAAQRVVLVWHRGAGLVL